MTVGECQCDSKFPILHPLRGRKRKNIEKRASEDCSSLRENMTEIKTDKIMPEKRRENSFSSPFNQRPTAEFSILLQPPLSCHRTKYGEKSPHKKNGKIVCTQKTQWHEIFRDKVRYKSSLKKCISVRSNLCGTR